MNNQNKFIIFCLLGILVLIYFISPFDIIPDYIGFIGYLDDFLVLITFIYGIIRSFYSVFNNFNESEYERLRAE